MHLDKTKEGRGIYGKSLCNQGSNWKHGETSVRFEACELKKEEEEEEEEDERRRRSEFWVL